MNDYYKLTGKYYPATDYERAEGKAPKMKAKPCRCAAYNFPHRLDSKACKELYDSGSDATYEDYRVEAVRDFDRTEARAINRGH